MKAMFYSVGEMAIILGIDQRSVYRLKEKIPGYNKLGGRIYYNRSTFHKATLGTQEPVDEVMPVGDKHNLIK